MIFGCYFYAAMKVFCQFYFKIDYCWVTLSRSLEVRSKVDIHMSCMTQTDSWISCVSQNETVITFVAQTDTGISSLTH